MNYKNFKKQPFLLLIGLVIGSGGLLYFGQSEMKASEPNKAEVGFAQDMSVHHQQAIEMSFLVREISNDSNIRNFAFDIINTQATQRGMMLGWLDLWQKPFTTTQKPMMWMIEDMSSIDQQQMMEEFSLGAYMPGMATPKEMDSLARLDGTESEKLFLELMIRHHEGGVMMANGVIERSGNTTITRLAKTMVDGQQAEIDYMKGLLLSY